MLRGPCLLLIPPTALHGFTYQDEVRGRILTLSDALVNSLFPKESPVMAMLSNLQGIATVQLPDTAGHIDQLMQAIHQELLTNQPEKRLMLAVFSHQLFLVIFRLAKRDQTEARMNNKSLQHFRKFQQRIKQVVITQEITQLAHDLSISPFHLNRICRSIAGKSASQLVQAHRLDEARRYLLYTTYSISDIASLLHFEYPNYFARFFKKHTGLTPTEFRQAKDWLPVESYR